MVLAVCPVIDSVGCEVLVLIQTIMLWVKEILHVIGYNLYGFIGRKRAGTQAEYDEQYVPSRS